MKVTVEDDGTANQQSGDPGGGAGAGLPTAVALALSQTSVSEKAGTVTITATLDAPAPPGGVTVALYPDPEASSTAKRDADYAMPDTISIPTGNARARPGSTWWTTPWTRRTRHESSRILDGWMR